MLLGLKEWAGRLPMHRWFRPDGSPAVIVLMYHDLCTDDDFANWLRVSVSDFERQLDTCAAMGSFLDPATILQPERIPDDRLTFLLTFDDGYRNNAELAAPLLARRRIPALFFVSTGPLISQRPLWTDVVITPIQALKLESLDLNEHGLGSFRFRAGDESVRWIDIQRLLEAIKATGNEDHPKVARLLDWLWYEFATVLEEQLPRYRPLTDAEIRAMAATEHCHFGSHGHEHRILPLLTDDELDESLARSRAILASLTGRPIDQLAYPNGNHDERVRVAAAKAGYRRAYSGRPGILAGRVDALDLPRIPIGAFDSPHLLRYKINRTLVSWRRRARQHIRLIEPEGGF